MTDKLKNIINSLRDFDTVSWYQEMIDELEVLLENDRDMPMKVELGFICPKCNSSRTSDDWDDLNTYCGDCGQRIYK